MKLFQIVSAGALIVSLLMFIPTAFAAVQFYGSDIDLGADGNAKITLTLTFEEPVKGFQLGVFGSVKNFNATSNAGPPQCQVYTGTASVIDCKMNLTEDKRTLELDFETADFVKTIDGKSLFSIDLSLSQNILQASTAVKLPEGYALANTTTIPEVTPPATNIVSDGRRIIVNWNIENVTSDKSFKFQTLYEPTKGAFPVTLVSIGVIALISFSSGAFLFYRRMRKPKEVILSVLDDFEKRVIEVITAAGGEINQRKVVQDTNLSKAKVSRVVKRLQERGLIEVTRLGRTNKLKLAQKKFGEN
ncbi:MAG: winged helix-turn-helix transcriptional regulator [Candidatus Aenigmarchaeota archaeon]|nr:winged helix-turn-helix transcriptional regulator [Candidatus Aenigmarchaeota archaeon]